MYTLSNYLLCCFMCVSLLLYLCQWQAGPQNCEATTSFVTSVCPSVRQHGTAWLPLDGFSWNLIFEYLKKTVEKSNQVSLKSHKNNGYFTWRPIYIFDNSSLSSSYNEKCFRQSCRDNQNTHFMFDNFFSEYRTVYGIMWENIVEPDRPQTAI